MNVYSATKRFLLATGAEPRTLSVEGADLPHVYRLRTLADSRAIVDRAQRAKHSMVIGSSFIGLEDVPLSLTLLLETGV